MKPLRLLGFVTALFLTLCGCRQEDLLGRGILVVGLEANPTNLDPRLSTDAASSRINGLLYSRLFRKNEAGEPVADIVEAWEQTDPTTCRFRIRKDILLAFPGILPAIALTSILGPSLRNVILALCVMGWVGYARIVRAQVLALRQSDFVLAARALGVPDARLLLRHIFPNMLAPLIVEGTFGIAGAILAEAGLSFLGPGTQPPRQAGGAC